MKRSVIWVTIDDLNSKFWNCIKIVVKDLYAESESCDDDHDENDT